MSPKRPPWRDDTPWGAAGADRLPLLPFAPERAARAGPPAHGGGRSSWRPPLQGGAAAAPAHPTQVAAAAAAECRPQLPPRRSESPAASSSPSPTPRSTRGALRAYCRLGDASGGSSPASTVGHASSGWSSESASPRSEAGGPRVAWAAPGWAQPCGSAGSAGGGGVPPPPAYGLLRSRTAGSDPQSPVSDPELGYASTLPRQGPLPEGALLVREARAVRAGRAGLRDGTHLFVVMVGDPDNIRLVHEQSLRATDWAAGHSSLVSPREFDSRWARGAWGPGHCRHTVLFAGELDYREGVGVLRWNNCSGHYKPACEDHWRVPLGHDTFQPVSLR